MLYGSEEFNRILVKIIREEYRHPHYEYCCKHAADMSIHVFGDIPTEILSRSRPGEDDAIKNYRLENYEPTTKAACGKAITIVSKIFNPNLSSIVFPNTDRGSALKEYTMEYYPEFNSIVNFNKEVTLKKTIADPNALMVVKPKAAPNNDQERISPIVVIYASHVIWNWDHEHYLVFLRKTEESGRILYDFEYIDGTNITQFTAVAPKNSAEGIILTINNEYFHMFSDADGVPEIPAWRLRGKAKPMDDGTILFESFFADAKAHWNLSIIHESDVLGAFVKHMHPQRYVVGEECTYSEVVDGMALRCDGGMLRGGTMSGKGIVKPCSKCGGTGRLSNSPYEDHVIMKKKLEDGTVSIDPIGYINVPVDATKMLEERSDSMIEKGSAAINMDIEDKIGENQSGIAKVYDRSAQNNTLFDIGVVLFDVDLNNQFYFIYKYRFGTENRSLGRTNDDSDLPQVNKPVEFQIETVGELIMTLQVATAAGVDRTFMQAKQIEIVSRDMETNPDQKKYYIAMLDLDPLPSMSQTDIDSNLMQGLVRKTDAAIHANLKSFVDKAIAEHADFLDMDKPEKIAILEGYGKELVKTEAPSIEVPAEMQVA